MISVFFSEKNYLNISVKNLENIHYKHDKFKIHHVM